MTTRRAERTDRAMTVFLDPHLDSASNRLRLFSDSPSNGSRVDLDAPSAGSLKSSTRISRLSVISSSVSYVCTLLLFLPHDSMFSLPVPQMTCVQKMCQKMEKKREAEEKEMIKLFSCFWTNYAYKKVNDTFLGKIKERERKRRYDGEKGKE